MLHEIVGLADEPPVKRRWFHDDYFDLFVWQTVSGEVVRFQLCYGIPTSEQALVWNQEVGFFLDGVGEEAPAAIFERFESVAPTVPKVIRQVVGARLQEFARQSPEVPARRREFRRATWQKRLRVPERKTG